MSVMHFIRQAKNKPEIFPIVGILGVALGGAVFMSIHQARAPDVVWNHKDNKFPWQDIREGQQVKLSTVNQKYDERWTRTQW